MNFSELTQQIEQAKTERPHIVVAVSGFAGSGKSSLAGRLGDHFGIEGGQIIRLDNLYTPEPCGTGLFDDYDWPLVETILADVHAGKPLHYQGRGFYGERHQFNEPLPEVVIIEGIQLFREQFMKNFDLSVWVNSPLEFAMERARARDQGQGHDEEYMKRWDTEWEPRNRQYFEEYHPDKLANVLYEDYK